MNGDFAKEAGGTIGSLRHASRGGINLGHTNDDGGVAQLAEQRTHKPRVTRSIRVTATNFSASYDSAAPRSPQEGVGGACNYVGSFPRLVSK